MTGQDIDPSHLSSSQQEALGTYTAVTNQESSAAVALLERSQWNVQVGKLRNVEPVIATNLNRLPLPSSLMGKLQIQWKKLGLPSHPRPYHPHNHHVRKSW